MANENVEPDARSETPLGGNLNECPAFQPLKPFRYASTPSYEGLQRHHRRNPIVRRPVKESLNARSAYTTSQDDGTAEHRINQYVIKQEIGRGSFGAVHLAADQYGNEYAVKEFSKSRLRKRAQSHLLRRPRGPQRGAGFNSPLHRHPSGSGDKPAGKAVDLIKEEIAIMKKIHHNNLVSLIEVLDDPKEDSLYMVMEMCKKGVVMKVGLEEIADPYDDERCRCWFRDMILGVEYLHAQGIVHRDIKPDNCLVTNDDVLKVVDFGVSEMFEKDSDMITAKSAGSPAFLPPELCVAKHGDVSGKAADIWSMGVTLYCLRYGKLPFEKESIFDLYEAIRNDPIVCEGEPDDNFKDLIFRILEKDPAKRITMDELREHSWVTKHGLDPLLPESENTAQIVEPPTEEEMNSAITKTVGHILAVIKAVKKFKRLIDPNKEEAPMQSILGQEYEAHFVEPPLEMEEDESFSMDSSMSIANKSQSLDTYNREAIERDRVLRGYHHQHDELGAGQPRTSEGAAANVNADFTTIRSTRILDESIDDVQTPWTPQSASPRLPLSRADSTATKRSVEGTRGHARDPLEEEFPFLFIGPSTLTGPSADGTDDSQPTTIFEEPESETLDTHLIEGEEGPVPIVSESPGAAEFNIYEIAYRQEIDRIRKGSIPRRGTAPKMYLNRRVDGKDDVRRLIQEEERREFESDQQSQQPTSQTVPAIGNKMPIPSSSFSSTVGMISAQLGELKKQPQSQPQNQSPPPAAPPPSSSLASTPQPEQTTTEPAASTTTTNRDFQSSPPENPRAKLRCLLGRVRGSWDAQTKHQ